MQIQGDDKELVWGPGSRVVKNLAANARDSD